jgi:DNA-binding SARP family transcriptional activator
VVPELTELTERYPLHEQAWARLLIALYRSGRRGDALAHW